MHLVGFIVGIRHDARSLERQIRLYRCRNCRIGIPAEQSGFLLSAIKDKLINLFLRRFNVSEICQDFSSNAWRLYSP